MGEGPGAMTVRNTLGPLVGLRSHSHGEGPRRRRTLTESLAQPGSVPASPQGHAPDPQSARGECHPRPSPAPSLYPLPSRTPSAGTDRLRLRGLLGQGFMAQWLSNDL